jgi:hypothetical protein
MSPSSWWHGISPRQVRPGAARPRQGQRARPVVEILEARLVPATFSVTNLNDSGAGSLRDAIAAANNSPDPVNTIDFAPGVHGTIGLATALPDLAQNVSLEGPGAESLIVTRSTAAGTPAFGIFTVGPGVQATLSGLTICHGSAADGGGIDNQGSLVLRDSIVCLSTASDRGGGIFSNPGTSRPGGLVIVNSLIEGNFTSGSSGAAGIDVESGTLSLTNSTVEGNQSIGAGNAGGIAVNGGTATLTSCTIAANTATGTVQAGGLDVAPGATAQLVNTLIAENAGGGPDIDVRGSITDLLQLGGPSGHNLIGNGTGAPDIVNSQNGDLVGTATSPIAAGLGSLQNNGGATPTMALGPGSPAIDAGSNPPPSGPQALEADQRGFTRVINGTIDIGAFESGATLVVTDTALAAAGGTAVLPGQPHSFTAAVTTAVVGAAPDVGGMPTLPDGTVHFTVDGQGPTDLTLAGGTATLNLPNGLAPGPHTITATYDGTSTFAGSVAVPFTVDVPAYGTTVTLTASASSANPGQPVTFTATVRPSGSGVPPVDGGSVTFLDGGRPLGSAIINPANRTAVLTTALSPGPHTITAVYSGDPAFAASKSSAVPVAVAQPLTGDVTSVVKIVLTPAPRSRRERSRGPAATLTIINTSGMSLDGPVSVVVRNLRGGTRLRGATGFVGTRKKKSPFVTVGGTAGRYVAPNDTVTLTLHFSKRPGPMSLEVFAGALPAG